jgi:sec-independent protein translocase protein TatA
VFGVGGQEVLVVLGVAFLVLGPRRLPEVGRALGRAARTLNDSLAEFRTAWEREAG